LTTGKGVGSFGSPLTQDILARSIEKLDLSIPSCNVSQGLQRSHILINGLGVSAALTALDLLEFNW